MPQNIKYWVENHDDDDDGGGGDYGDSRPAISRIYKASRLRGITEEKEEQSSVYLICLNLDLRDTSSKSCL